jgi:hypothetical protein
MYAFTSLLTRTSDFITNKSYLIMNVGSAECLSLPYLRLAESQHKTVPLL